MMRENSGSFLLTSRPKRLHFLFVPLLATLGLGLWLVLSAFRPASSAPSTRAPRPATENLPQAPTSASAKSKTKKFAAEKKQIEEKSAPISMDSYQIVQNRNLFQPPSAKPVVVPHPAGPHGGGSNFPPNNFDGTRPVIQPTPPDPLAGWAYVGWVKLDEDMVGLLESPQGDETRFVRRGEGVFSAAIVDISPDTITYEVNGQTKLLTKTDRFNATPLVGAPGNAMTPQGYPGNVATPAQPGVTSQPTPIAPIPASRQPRPRTAFTPAALPPDSVANLARLRGPERREALRLRLEAIRKANERRAAAATSE